MLDDETGYHISSNRISRLLIVQFGPPASIRDPVSI